MLTNLGYTKLMRNLKSGDVGHDVAEWQTALGITSDGVFGRQTEEATKAWQKSRGLVADGVVGPISWQAMFDVGATMLRGIDVSPAQGTIPWELVAKAGINFAIGRAAVGNEAHGNARFQEYRMGARAQGIAFGGYTFVYPLPHLSARAQAAQHVRALEMCGALEGEIVPMADLEWPPREEWKVDAAGQKILTYPWKRWGCSAEQIAEFCLTYLDETFHLTGLKWGRYSFGYWTDCVEMYKYPEFAEGPLWFAHYWSKGHIPTKAEIQALKVPGPWTSATIIQHDGDGGLRLPNGVDADFNIMPGGRQALARLSQGSKLWSPLKAVEPAVRVVLHDGDDEIREYRRTRLQAPPVVVA